MTNALPISRLINVTVNLAPSAAQAQNISTLLILGSSNVIDLTERYRTYLSIAAVATDFGTSAPEYLAAVLWFEQAPQPSALLIGRWAQTATAALLRGATEPAANQSMALWNAITTGSFEVVVDNVPLSILSLSFASVTNMNGVASAIQTALQAQAVTMGMSGPSAAAISFVWNSNFNRFELQSGTTGVTSTMQFVRAPTASGFFNFSGQPVAGTDTITLNGTVWSFVSALTTGNQILVGGTLAATLTNCVNTLKASTETQTVKFDYYTAGNYLYVEAVASGVGGNSLTIAKSSANITVSGATLAGAGTTDISTTLAMASTSSGAYVTQGFAAETAISAVTTFDSSFGQLWYGLQVTGAVDADHLAIAAYIEAANNKHIYGVTTTEAGVLVSTDTSNIAYQLQQLAYRRTAVQFSSSNQYAVASLFGRILTVDYTGNNTVITLMYKQEPGIVPETLNATQIGALEGFNANVFVAYNNNTAIIEKGTMASGDFIDIITGTDWLALTIQTAVFNLLYTTTTKVPQTDAGNQLISTTIESVCAQGVINGLLAPGTWTTTGFGGLSQGDFLPKGYYVFAPPIAQQNPADRAARKSVTFQVAAKLAGAIHTVSIQINVNR